MTVVHAFSSAKADGGDATLVQPSNWNAAHTVTDLVQTIAGAAISVTNPWVNGTNSVNAVTQAHYINLSNGAGASTDVVCTADTGTDTTLFINMGINSSGWSTGTWTINGALDGYLYVQGANIAVGTDTAGKIVQIFTGGTLAANERARFTDTYQAIKNATLEERLGGVIWTKTSATTLATFTTAATLIGASGTGVGTLTLPANFLTVGRTLRIKMRGLYGTTTAAPTLNFLLSIGGVTVWTSGAISMTTVSMTNKPWEGEFEITCRATGSTATLFTSGRIVGFNTITVTATQNHWIAVNTAAANVNTAATAVIDLTCACSASNAANTITMNHCTIEVVG